MVRLEISVYLQKQTAMKLTKLLLISLLAVSCRRDETSALLPTGSEMSFAPIWRDNDTLMNSQRIYATDTMLTFKHGDTTGVYYHGETLYVFGYNFDSNATSSRTAWIGATIFDTATAYSKCVIGQYKYFSVGDNRYKYQQQFLGIITRYPHFATTGDAYYIGR